MTAVAGPLGGRALALAVPLLAVATAVVVAVEFAVVGLLPEMARDLDISLAQAGGLISAFAFAAALLGPTLTLAVSRIEPRLTLTAVAAVFGIGNVVAASAAEARLVLMVRVVEGAALPVFVSIGALAVSSMAAMGREGRAIAQVNIGTIVGLVLALPAAVAVAAATNWRVVFASLGACSLGVALALLLLFPRSSAQGLPPVSRQVSVLRSPILLGHLGLSAAVFAAMFAAYGYLAAFLEQEAGYSAAKVALTLMGFGAVGLVGNWVAGRAVDRWPLTGTAASVLLVGLAVGGISLAGAESDLFFPLLTIWAAAHAAAFVLCQVRVMRTAKEAPAFAMSLNIAACNLGIAIGGQVGGYVIQTAGLSGIGIGTVGFALVALGFAAMLGWVGRAPAQG